MFQSVSIIIIIVFPAFQKKTLVMNSMKHVIQKIKSFFLFFHSTFHPFVRCADILFEPLDDHMDVQQ